MSTDNSPSFGLGTMPNLANAQAKEAAIAPSGWINSDGNVFANYGSGLQPLANNGTMQIDQYGGARYAAPPVDMSQSGLGQDWKNQAFDSLIAQNTPPQMQSTSPQAYGGSGSSNYSQYPIAQGFQQQPVNQNPQMTFDQFQQQMFGGAGQGFANQMQQAMAQQAQQQNKMQLARGIAQKVGMGVAGLLGGAAGLNAAGQAIAAKNSIRSQNDLARAQAQMDMLRFAADNDPNSLKNRMTVMQAWQQYQNQNADNARAQAALDETARHNKAGEAATTAANDLAQAQLKYNMSNDSFKNWLAAQQFGETKSNNAATQKHQANVDALAQFMQGHTLAQDALANKRADAQTAYQNAQLANANRTYNLQANAQQQARQDKQAEVIFDKNNKPQAKYDYSRLNPPAAKAAQQEQSWQDAIAGWLGMKPAQAAQPSQPSSAAPVTSLDARSAAIAELKRRGAL